MATAYAQSHNSQCLKRHVGATIVDQRNRAISVGYNENPTGIAPCINQFGNCFKDADMHAKLEARDGVHCPACGTRQMRLSDPWLCSNNGCLENLKSALFPDRNMYLCTAIHAEEQAIRSLGDRKGDGCTIYTTTFPCFQCARQIIDVGIKRVVFVEAYPVVEALSLLESAKIVVEPFQGFKARAFNLVF